MLFRSESPDISLCQAMVGRLCPTNFGGMSLGCCVSGRPLILVHLPFMSLFSGTLVDFDCPSYNAFFFYVVKERPDLEN